MKNLDMNKILLFSCLGLLGLTQIAHAETIFSCKTGNNKRIEVQKVNKNLYEYKFGRASKNELTIRNKKSELLGRSEKWQGIGRAHRANMKFQNGEYIYSVWVNFDDSMQYNTDSGVDIELRGKLIAQIKCTPKTVQKNFNDDEFSW